jgi:hypothetical protein
LGAAGLTIGADELHDPASGNELGLRKRRLAAARSSAGHQCADRRVELPRVGTSGWLGLRERRVGPAGSPAGDWRRRLASSFQFSASASSNNEKGRESCGLFSRTTRVRTAGGTCKPVNEIRKPEAGSRELETGNWKLETGNCITTILSA